MDNNLIDFKKFPTTRYQGSKRKIVPWLHETFNQLKFHTVLDACGGSASVSYLLKKMGKEVVYNDKLNFNYIIGKAIIENSKYKLTPKDLKDLSDINSKFHYKNFIEETFKDIYYLDSENRWLDTMATNITNMNHYKPGILQYKKSLAFYALFQSSMIKRPFNLFHRKNLNIRTNEVERNFGNKATWERPFDEYFLRFAEEANSLIFDSGVSCKATKESIFDIDPYGYDMIYIDIPYLKKNSTNESADYLGCYHFLEGISEYNEWNNLIDPSSIHKRIRDIDKENDFKKANIYDSVEQILYKFRKSKIVFSYKKGGIPSIDFIVKTMKALKKDVQTVSIHYKYALNHQNGDAVKNREVLIIGQ